MRKAEHDEHCRQIAETLEKYASGNYFEYNGELYPIDDEDFWNTTENSCYLDDDGFYYYDIDGEKINQNDIEPVSIYDYFSDDDIFNINYILDSNKELEAVRVMVACGGPNIYINTWDKRVELFWWTEQGESWLTNEVCEEINNFFNDYFYC